MEVTVLTRRSTRVMNDRRNGAVHIALDISERPRPICRGPFYGGRLSPYVYVEDDAELTCRWCVQTASYIT